MIAGEGTIVINGIATVGYFPSPFYFNSYAHFDLRNPNAHIEIGDGVIFNNNATLIADGATISIGADALIGLNVTIMTSDAHGLEPEKRRSLDFPRENVSIGDNVFIGNDVTILKGVRIGNNSVECISEGKDQYKRTLAECFVKNESLSIYLVRSGYAFAYRKYSKKFIEDENFAKTNQFGMWSMKFEYPWDFRKNN